LTDESTPVPAGIAVLVAELEKFAPRLAPETVEVFQRHFDKMKGPIMNGPAEAQREWAGMLPELASLLDHINSFTHRVREGRTRLHQRLDNLGSDLGGHTLARENAKEPGDVDETMPAVDNAKAALAAVIRAFNEATQEHDRTMEQAMDRLVDFQTCVSGEQTVKAQG
jgi:hypothetical protein